MSRLIILEGIDGSGKTTLAKALCDKLSTQNMALFLDKKSIEASTAFQKRFMSQIRSILWELKKTDPINEIDEETWLYLHMLWYHMLQEYVIKHQMILYDYIVMDGWYFKFLARHIANDKIAPELAYSLFSRLIQGNLVVLLNVPPEICIKRKEKIKPSECGIHRDTIKDSMKKSFCNYQQKVFDAYRILSGKYHFTNIDASGTIEKSLEQVIKAINEYFVLN